MSDLCCPICLNFYTNSRIFQCGHALCGTCHLRISNTSCQCPLCRRDISTYHHSFALDNAAAAAAAAAILPAPPAIVWPMAHMLTDADFSSLALRQLAELASTRDFTCASIANASTSGVNALEILVDIAFKGDVHALQTLDVLTAKHDAALIFRANFIPKFLASESFSSVSQNILANMLQNDSREFHYLFTPGYFDRCIRTLMINSPECACAIICGIDADVERQSLVKHAHSVNHLLIQLCRLNKQIHVAQLCRCAINIGEETLFMNIAPAIEHIFLLDDAVCVDSIGSIVQNSHYCSFYFVDKPHILLDSLKRAFIQLDSQPLRESLLQLLVQLYNATLHLDPLIISFISKVAQIFRTNENIYGLSLDILEVVSTASSTNAEIVISSFISFPDCYKFFQTDNNYVNSAIIKHESIVVTNIEFLSAEISRHKIEAYSDLHLLYTLTEHNAGALIVGEHCLSKIFEFASSTDEVSFTIAMDCVNNVLQAGFSAEKIARLVQTMTPNYSCECAFRREQQRLVLACRAPLPGLRAPYPGAPPAQELDF